MASKRESIEALRKKLLKQEEKFLEEIFKIAKKIVYERDPGQKKKEEIENLIEESFFNTYKTTSIEMKKIYKEVQDFIVEDIKDLTYKEDGKTYLERLDEYYEKVFMLLNNNISKEEILLDYRYNLMRLLGTESRHIETAVKKNKKPVYAHFIMVSSGECGSSCPGGVYESEEGVDLPPFHPNCGCIWWHEITDDLDEAEELSDEVEE